MFIHRAIHRGGKQKGTACGKCRDAEQIIRKAMRDEPDIDWLLKNQDKVSHYFHQQGVEGNI